jgi:hypothetical protein
MVYEGYSELAIAASCRAARLPRFALNDKW